VKSGEHYSNVCFFVQALPLYARLLYARLLYARLLYSGLLFTRVYCAATDLSP